ncbi:MAG: CDP-6-deoxy-delta-3,4-glucoseen reductase [Rhodocyclaceae bacterium]|nr:CDP-6-deoxy-L-threo-D-glycero-4-hexulose-3-dehydrase reductase [Rhodocyclaceae bacterium]MBZ0143031.1 CDP-6-deoxy-delta-3,4-glucoseen reductase [Rhodocyclaceae bacterium]
MSHRVTIESSGHQFDVEPGNTILRAALAAGIGLPYGCRNGACGACKGRVVSGQVDRGLYSEGALSGAELGKGYALFCCARPLSDLVIESREVDAVRDIPVKTLPARVQKMARLAPDVMLLQLKLPASERLQFLAGQYIDILLKGGRRRSFSIANAPETDECLELHVRRVPGGHFTTHVFETMKERDLLRLEGPHGGFHLREDGAKPVILLAGGTGFAPVKAMVEHAFHRQSLRPMTLYWGARDRAGLYLHELAEGWAAGRAGFDYVPVLSEPAAGDGWPGRTGLVHRAVMADFPDLSGHRVYACGAPAMIEAARSDLIGGCGLKEEDFFADSFTFATDSTRP